MTSEESKTTITVPRCYHCMVRKVEVPDGLVCVFCLDGDECGAHENLAECMEDDVYWAHRNTYPDGLGYRDETNEEISKRGIMADFDYALDEIIANGHELYGFCAGCGAAIATCDMPACFSEAYKFIDGISEDLMAARYQDDIQDDTFYYCEEHYDVWRPESHFDENGEIKEEHEDDEEPDWVVMYHPGSRKNCYRCDFPY